MSTYGVMGWWTHWAVSRTSQCFTTGITKAIVCLWDGAYKRTHATNQIQLWSTGWKKKYLNVFSMMDRSDDPSHHKWTLYHGATSLLPLEALSYKLLPSPQMDFLDPPLDSDIHCMYIFICWKEVSMTKETMFNICSL